MGVFSECVKLSSVTGGESLETIGFYPESTQTVMPDAGAFSGCHRLPQITLSKELRVLGAEVFNSCGLVELSIEDEDTAAWGREIRVHTSAFHHTAVLQWMKKTAASKDGSQKLVWQIGLPKDKEKILRCDSSYGFINELPRIFFTATPREMDDLTISPFRLDYAGRMAVARLEGEQTIDEETLQRYTDLLVSYFEEADLYGRLPENNEDAVLDLLCSSRAFEQRHVTTLIHKASERRMEMRILLRLLDIRRERFGEYSGFEELEI